MVTIQAANEKRDRGRAANQIHGVEILGKSTEEQI